MVNREVFKITRQTIIIYSKVKGIDNVFLSRDKSNQR